MVRSDQPDNARPDETPSEGSQPDGVQSTPTPPASPPRRGFLARMRARHHLRQQVRFFTNSGAFDGDWYLTQNPDVRHAGVDPLLHFLNHGAAEGRDPNPLFDTAWYLFRYRDVKRAGINPLEHYLRHGAAEGRDPGPLFDTDWYRSQYPDVASSGLNPLAHYLRIGAAEGRQRRSKWQESTTDDPIRQLHAEGLHEIAEYFLPFIPLNVVPSPELSGRPTLNLLLPSLRREHASGGPNTAFNLVYRLAHAGIAVRFISTDAPPDEDSRWLWSHLATLTGITAPAPAIALVDGSNRSKPVRVGMNDVFFATAWWTAQMAHAAARGLRQQRMLYLIQDFEPLLYAASEQYALAHETYAFDHQPIINTGCLRDYLVENGIGRYGDPGFVARALSFEPSVDRELFRPVPDRAPARRRLLFYARPRIARRNLFGMGVVALRQAIEAKVFEGADWEFLGMGEPFEPVPLGKGKALRPAPWHDLDGYATQMRESDILLSLMMSPHPSYPPLEMAACGGLVVTTEYATKTARRLSAISRNIIAAPATVQGLVEALARAVICLGDRDGRLRGAQLSLPQTWSDSFAPILSPILEELERLGIRRTAGDTARAGPAADPTPAPADQRSDNPHASPAAGARAVSPPAPATPEGALPAWHDLALGRERVADGGAGFDVSVVSCVYERTDLPCLREAAASVAGQSRKPREWVIVAQGALPPELQSYLAELAAAGTARVLREPVNHGIAGGFRKCLEAAAGTWILSLDADDVLAPGAVAAMAEAIAAEGAPEILFGDEDLLIDGRFRHPYSRPDFDPILNLENSYIWHPQMYRRETALKIGVYTNTVADFAQDWDTITRFHLAGHVPRHVRQVLYHWRQHPRSVSHSGSLFDGSFRSVEQVLKQHIGRQADPALYEPAPYPAARGAPELHIRRRPVAPPKVALVHLGTTPAGLPGDLANGSFPYCASIAIAAGTARAADVAAHIESLSADLVHLLSDGSTPFDDEGLWNAIKLLEFVPDLFAVGGPLMDRYGTIVRGPLCADGDGRLVDTFTGRRVDWSGWFAMALKPHTVSYLAPECCLVRSGPLLAMLSAAAGDTGLAQLGMAMMAHAQAHKLRIGYDPLFRSYLDEARALSPPNPAVIATAATTASVGGVTGAAVLRLNELAFRP